MPISILPILDLMMPFDITSISPSFVNFYKNAESLITISQKKDYDIYNLYDIIISTIENSQLSDAKGTKTNFKSKYENEKESVRVLTEMYYLKVVEFVRKLQLLVLTLYDTISDFYEDLGITVSQIFADISEDAGYPIPDQYIKDIS
jgi:hypothetical protein